jgi:L-lactate dehydrogenase
MAVEVNNRKVAVIGCGFVGSASAFALMESGLFSEWCFWTPT